MQQLPLSFIQRTKYILQYEFDTFLQALNLAPPVSLRVNDKIVYMSSNERVPWCPWGYYLQERRLFTADPLFHAGVYYVQEASSMFLYQALNRYVSTKATVLDLCAAPGGKSTLISQFLTEGLLISNEVVKNRAYVLAENTIKWGNAHVLVSNNAPKDFGRLPAFFDAVVVDAPCSGEGMFRKDPEAIGEWSEHNVAMCAARQKDILRDVWDTLKTDGILIYSTCTYNREENEHIVEWVENELSAQFLPIDTTLYPEIVTTEKGYRFYQHRTKGEGFFIAVLRKTASISFSGGKQKSKTASQLDMATLSLKRHLKTPDKWSIFAENNIVSAVESIHADKIVQLRRQLRVLHAGVVLAERKGKDFVPNISLALSKQIATEQFVVQEVDLDTALRYLRKEAIMLTGTPLGYVLLQYRSVAIGWVKNLGNRCNNLYPNEWRIRMRIDKRSIDDTTDD